MWKTIRIGTRASMLALAQSNWIKGRIEAQYPGCSVELVKIVTKGDKIVDVPLAKVGGKGLFVKEIEEALLRREVDIAVHSMKDVPAELPEGLHIGIITEREKPFDAFITNNYKTLAEVPQGATIGTSSLRRKAQLARLRPDLKIEDLRGNLDTRLRKLDEGVYDAIILAAAGLNRLDLFHRATFCFQPDEMLPAVAQGAVGIELRRADEDLLQMLSFMDHRETTLAVHAERSYLKRLEGGCQVPLAGFATLAGQTLTINGLIASVDGGKMVKAKHSGPAAQAKTLGLELAEELLAMGGREILEEVYGASLK
ncbi:hydroxymethylbilane synthase [Desulfurivibrio alkaliphilus]|uniref:Porphobilinogen deaminase n=1 Tax=Desulfurivibrio alkaliphilus (strain DSM 19089 / UNIQEM U267 / AHT2) TaxID=589865 RepID=D6Z0L2_DESAT|nr:hydroxymethylbilane synthase [Desulfurivibrio alkaliphilus]ADH85241.1 porphobilinogen deaminase [Desulfurivibrio alkaliphilus AHT 2]